MHHGDLFAAIVAGRVQHVYKELAMGASPSSQDGMGRTGLHYAAVLHDEQIASILLVMCSVRNLTITDDHGRTALHYAAASNSLSIATALLQRGAQASCSDHQQVTPLHLAAELAGEAMVELLLAHGGSPKARDVRGRTPLDYAERRGNDAAAAALTDGEHRDEKGSASLMTGSRSSASHVLSSSSSCSSSNIADPSLSSNCSGRAFHRFHSDSAGGCRPSPSVQLLGLAAAPTTVAESRGMAGGASPDILRRLKMGVSPAARRPRVWAGESDSGESGGVESSSGEGGAHSRSSTRGSGQSSRPWRRSSSSSSGSSKAPGTCNSDDNRRGGGSDSGSSNEASTWQQQHGPSTATDHASAVSSSIHAENQSSPPPPCASPPACQCLSPRPSLPRSETAPAVCPSSSASSQTDLAGPALAHTACAFPHSESYPAAGNRVALSTTGSPPSRAISGAEACRECPYHSAGRLSPSAMHPSALLARVCDVVAESTGVSGVKREASLEEGGGGGTDCVCGGPERDGTSVGSCAAQGVEKREEGKGSGERGHSLQCAH